MSIRFKITYGFITLAVMLFFAGMISLLELKNMGQSVEKVLNKDFISMSACQQMLASINDCHHGMLMLLEDDKKTGRMELAAADSNFIQQLKSARENISIPGEDTLINSIEKLYLSYRKLWQEPETGIEESKKLKWFYNEVSGDYFSLLTKIEMLRTLNRQNIYNTTASIKNMARRAIMPGIVAIVAAIVFAFIFNYFIIHYLVTPVQKISKGIDDFAAYQIPLRVNIETNDELLKLKNSVENLINKFRLLNK